MHYFNFNLKRIRNFWGLSPKSIANDIGARAGTYVNWEKGAVPDLETIILIARKFHISLNDFILKELDEKLIPSIKPLSKEELDSDEGSSLMISPNCEQQIKGLKEQLEERERKIEELSLELLSARKKLIKYMEIEISEKEKQINIKAITNKVANEIPSTEEGTSEPRKENRSPSNTS